jgi:hypothetical protein
VQAYDFDIEYVKGKNNVVANALSRKPTTFSMSEIAALEISPFSRVFQECFCRGVDRW